MALTPRLGRLLCAGGVAACAAGVAVSGELSPGALLAVGAAGLAVCAVALARRAGEDAAPVGPRGLPWLAWLAAALAWEGAALADADLPTVSDLADPVLAHPGARAAATVGWLAAGLWLAARPGRRT
ncbi:hypothetical protein ACI782_11475 [Geodermatophilus sp. SYSU D00703]